MNKKDAKSQIWHINETMKIMKQIDQLAYELYGLTKEEIAIVENS